MQLTMTLIEHLPAVLGRYLWAGILGRFLILTGWSGTRGNTSQIMETLAHLLQAETQTSNPCGGPNPLASTNEDILMSGLFAGV